jgi:hypothetical protein
MGGRIFNEYGRVSEIRTGNEELGGKAIPIPIL